MSAEVIDLASRRPKRRCACESGWTCPPHRLAELAVRLRAARGTDLADEALTDALAVIDGITTHYRLPDERATR